MAFWTEFIKRMKSEPRKKSFQWTVSGDKVLWLKDNRKLRRACLDMRGEGLRRHRFHMVRDWFMVEVGLLTGLRVMEIRNLRVGDMLIHSEFAAVHVRRGKGGKKRDVLINSELKHKCAEFLRLRRKFRLDNGPESYVFCSGTGKPLTIRALQKAFKRCLARAGIAKTYTCHCMRHTFGTFLLDLSNLRVVQEQLGHSSVKTTEIYTSLIQKSVRKSLEKIYR
jgi:site-specific recombinase XerD